MIECSFATLLGEKVNYHQFISRGSAIRFIEGEKGILSSIEGINEAKKMPGIQEIEIYISIGDSIRRLENSSDRIGHIIAIGKDAKEATQNVEAALKKIHITVS